MLGRRWFRDRTAPDALAGDHDISRATAYRYVDELIAVLAEEASELRDALERARDKGVPHVILDGKIIPADRCGEKTLSVKNEVIDLWYSGKARTDRGNIQAIFSPRTGSRSGYLMPSPARLMTSPPPASTPCRGLYWAAAADLPTLAGPATTAPALAFISRSSSPPADGNSILAPAPAMPSSAPCAVSANAGSPCSTSAGALSSTSPPAPARSATLPAPHSSSPIWRADWEGTTRCSPYCEVSGREEGEDCSPSLINEIVREGARRMLVEAPCAEVDAYIAAHAAERDENGHRLVVRSGSHQPREILTSAGAIQVTVPRVNDKRTDPATGERHLSHSKA